MEALTGTYTAKKTKEHPVWRDEKGRKETEISIMGGAGKTELWDAAAGAVLLFGAVISVLAVTALFFYVVSNGIPALKEVGMGEALFGTVWKPVAADPRYGMLQMILASLAGAFLAALIGMPIGVLTAVFLVEISGKRAAGTVRAAVELLAGIPSVVYGLLGVYLLNPLMYRLELKLFADSPAHRFTGGANLLSASLVLAVMILPTVINVSETAIRRVSPDIRAASLALGASQVQTVFRVVLPAARSGIAAAVVLGLGRALGEATAVMLVAGNSVEIPLPFHSVRFLTTTIVSEMGYSHGIHRQMLFTMGLVLFLLIMLFNMLLGRSLRKGGQSG